MARAFITGSTPGLGRAAAQALIIEGHEIVLHAGSTARAKQAGDIAFLALAVVVDEFSSEAESHSIAGQVNRVGRMDAVINNAGIYPCLTAARRLRPSHCPCGDTVAPYILSALIERPSRLVYLSIGLHRGDAGSL
jgi:NAD(P)-dependent dehydrogenase (short-subunit alcohol dehydrogenase family)